jgi:2-oxoglutarate/2-oxoacid ferredoxin oxidoreductase subunit alpha
MHRDEIVLTKCFATEDADVLLVAFGGTTGASRAAALELRKRGVKAGVLQLITLWPFADKEVALYGSRAKTVVVTEMNYSGQVAGEVQKVLGSGADIRRVNSYNGQIITPQEILKVIG